MIDKTAQVIDITASTKQYVVRSIKEEYPDMDLSEGSPFVDMFVNPISPIVSPLIDLIGRIELKTNLANAELMTEEELDEIAEGNYFYRRKQGGRSFGEVVFYLRTISDDDNFVIPQGVIVSTDEGLKYQIISRVEFTPDELYLMYNPESLMYEVFAPIEGVDVGIEYDIDKGKIKNIDTPFSDKVVSVENPSEITGGESKESNKDFADRIRNFYVSRNLGTRPGYEDFIAENFTEVQKSYVVGKGSKFMDRDILTYKNALDEIVDKHIGGKVDIYIRGESFDTDSQSTIVQNNIFRLTQQEISEPSIKVYLKGDPTKAARAFTSEHDVVDDIYKVTVSEYEDKETLVVEYTYSEVSDIFYDEFEILAKEIGLEGPVSAVISITNKTASQEIDISVPGSYSLVSLDNEFDTTSRERKQLSVTSPEVCNGDECVVVHSYSRTLNLLEKIFTLEENKIITTDVLFKKAISTPINLAIELKTKGGVVLTTSQKSAIKRSISSFLSDMEMGDTIEESDIVARLYEDESVMEFLRYIKLPLTSLYVTTSPSEDVEIGRRELSSITSEEIEYFILNKLSIIEI